MLCLPSVLLSLIIPTVVGFKFLESTTLGPDPRTINRLNGESFQQDPLVTFNGFQYAVLWEEDTHNASIRRPSVARRPLDNRTKWEKFTFIDYNQTSDDGHNVISLGISRGDGTLHLGFDQHDNNLNYRISKAGVATMPTGTWSPELFGPILDHLPGLGNLDRSTFFINVTYPRFLTIPSQTKTKRTKPSSDLLLELRVGRSGLGDDWLYRYTPNDGWTQIGRYLEGVNNNAYINGLDFDSKGSLHTTWTYRDFVNDAGQNVAVEAGPNGPENNHDMDYAFSPDLGVTWQNNWGQHIANTSNDEPIRPVSAGITIFSIPKFGGILNQETQTVDNEGRVHVLNRENTTRVEQWYHYWRSTTKAWTRSPLPLPAALPSLNNVTGTPTVIGKRAKLLSPPPRKGQPTSLLAILPSNAPNSTALSILGSTATGHFRDWSVLWEISEGCGWEPLFDRYRLEQGVLSLYVVNGTNVQVWDFEL
ncbi:hypothetical protein BXZ70DRAFT_887078 [Cristinia sonorae]|uniref:Uncharacterized protein n=1 Tax=Cristinia sonorae TaxID=1940300 RepID=A0A8K0UV56_9AGAR|nr:hypothetical protein BXZ70DRAFT_887078 [Cristinia sonorae]